MVHFKGVSKCVRILIVLVNVCLVRQPGDVSSQLLQFILWKASLIDLQNGSQTSLTVYVTPCSDFQRCHSWGYWIAPAPAIETSASAILSIRATISDDHIKQSFAVVYLRQWKSVEVYVNKNKTLSQIALLSSQTYLQCLCLYQFSEAINSCNFLFLVLLQVSQVQKI